MKKIVILTLLLAFLSSFSHAQQKQIDSLKAIISASPIDTVKMNNLIKLAKIYYVFKPDSAIKTVSSAYALAIATKKQKQQGLCLTILSNSYVGIGDYGKAMQFYFKSIELYESMGYKYGVIQIENNIGSTYNQRREYKKALQYLHLAKKQHDAYVAENKKPGINMVTINIYILENLAESYLSLRRIDSAAYFLNLGVEAEKSSGYYAIAGGFDNDFGELEVLKDDHEAAMRYFRKATADDIKVDDVSSLDFNYLSIARMFQKYHQPDSAVYYVQQSLMAARKGGFLQDALDASKFLSKLYDEQHDFRRAYKYYKEATNLNDSLYNQDKIRELVSIDFEEKQHRQELAQAKDAYANTITIYVFAGGLTVLFLLVLVFWRNSRQRKKANVLLHLQKEEVQNALSQLQLTQRQLIQSEKMASLGELTAGIAHEIQNPLNFVNNFSEVNREMIGELKDELKEGNIPAALSIADDIGHNEEKISHHGKRADSIVKGMLEHSRTSTGQKEATDINKLADEYLRLAYHGLRAKDKSFNAELVTYYNDSLSMVNVVPQDIGRVLLNLFNNAFYAVNQKAKTGNADYKPTVEISTFAPPSGGWGVTVGDNGNGIPEAIKDKIMQPFFTTKPTGEGTGLGLSLTYDIVVKGHGGKIEVNTKEGEFTEFVITLPAN